MAHLDTDTDNDKSKGSLVQMFSMECFFGRSVPAQTKPADFSVETEMNWLVPTAPGRLCDSQSHSSTERETLSTMEVEFVGAVE